MLWNRHYSLIAWAVVAGHTAASRHRGSQQDPIVRASLFRNTIEPIHDAANWGEGGYPHIQTRGGLADTWLLYSEATRGRRRTDDRRDGHLLTLRAFLPSRANRHGSTDESYSSGQYTTVIVMRGTYLYRKRVLFHWSRHSVYKGPVSCPPLFLYFSLSRSSGDKGDAVARSITKRNFRTRLLERFFVRARVTERGRSMRFQVDISRLPRQHKGKESLVSVTQNGFRVINTAGGEIADGYVTVAAC